MDEMEKKKRERGRKKGEQNVTLKIWI